MRPVTGRNSTSVWPSRTAIRRQRVVAGWPFASATIRQPAFCARNLGRAAMSIMPSLSSTRHRPPRGSIFRPAASRTPAGIASAPWDCARAAGSPTCPGRAGASASAAVGNPASARRAAPQCCRRPGAAYRPASPAGLSITIASASMKRMRSTEHGRIACDRPSCNRGRDGYTVEEFVTPLQRTQGIQRVTHY